MRELRLRIISKDRLQKVMGSDDLIGRVGEDRGTTIIVDATEWGLSDVTFSINLQRPDKVSWPILAGALGPTFSTEVPPEAVEVVGKNAILEVVAVDSDGRIIKSAKFKGRVDDSLSVGSKPLPGAADWKDDLALEAGALREQLTETEGAIDTMIGDAEDTLGGLVGQVAEYADRAAEDRADAQEAATRASEFAAVAERGMHVVTLSIDDEGYLVQHMTDDRSAIHFAVNDGYLEVSING